MAKINMPALQIAIAKDSTGELKKAAQKRVNEVFDDAVIGMRMEFEEHLVTLEIDGGVGASNISETLGGGPSPKNLYSFIGFSAADSVSPLEPIRDALNPDTVLGKAIGPRIHYVGKEMIRGAANFNFLVEPPDKQMIYKSTPMPWAPGLSWAQKIETSIPGFAYFIARIMGDPSQSGGGIQAKDKDGKLVEVRGDKYDRPSNGYLTTIIENFRKRIKNYKKGGLRKRF